MVPYIERWLQAPVQEEDGQLVPRVKGTPQGGVISPLLATLFLQYAFDRRMAKQYPQMVSERYADDAIVHGRTVKEVQQVGGHSRPFEGMWVGASSGKDEGGLLQGW